MLRLHRHVWQMRYRRGRNELRNFSSSWLECAVCKTVRDDDSPLRGIDDDVVMGRRTFAELASFELEARKAQVGLTGAPDLPQESGNRGKVGDYMGPVRCQWPACTDRPTHWVEFKAGLVLFFVWWCEEHAPEPREAGLGKR